MEVNRRWFSHTTFWGKTAVMVIWLFMVTILIFAYRNVLLSTLITTTFEKPIDNVDDMLKHKVYTFLHHAVTVSTLVSANKENAASYNRTRL